MGTPIPKIMKLHNNMIKFRPFISLDALALHSGVHVDDGVHVECDVTPVQTRSTCEHVA